MSWTEAASPEQRNTLDNSGILLQEAIYELISTEAEYVSNMKIWSNLVRKRLQAYLDCENSSFEKKIYLNSEDILNIHLKLLEALQERQTNNFVVSSVADILNTHLYDLACYVAYAEGYLQSYSQLEAKRKENAAFDSFLREVENLPELKSMSLQNFIQKPLNRLTKYPLLLAAIQKRLDSNCDEYKALEVCQQNIKETLKIIDEATGKNSNKRSIEIFLSKLKFESDELRTVVVREIENDQTKLLREGPLLKRSAVDFTEYHVALFNCFLLLCRVDHANNTEIYLLKKKFPPLYFEFLIVLESSKLEYSALSVVSLSSSNVIRSNRSDSVSSRSSKFPFSLLDLKAGFSVTLYASTFSERKQWIDIIEQHSKFIRIQKEKFSFMKCFALQKSSKMTMKCMLLHKNKLYAASDKGLFVFFDPFSASCNKMQLDNLDDISHMAITKNDILFVRNEKKVFYYMLSTLFVAAPKRKKLAAGIGYFKIGWCNNMEVLAVSKQKHMASVIKIFEVINESSSLSSRFAMLVKSDPILLYRKIYIGSQVLSINFLSSKMVVGCVKGFELTDLDAVYTQDLLDPNDSHLEFIKQKEYPNALGIFKIDGDSFFLCYSEFGFFVNKSGERQNSQIFLEWMKVPYSFGNQLLIIEYRDPFLFCFTAQFVSIWNLHTGMLEQLIPANRPQKVLIDGNVAFFQQEDAHSEIENVYSIQIRNK